MEPKDNQISMFNKKLIIIIFVEYKIDYLVDLIYDCNVFC